jgi:hypothetical protein
MGIWTASIEAKASIIHSQLVTARSLASVNNGDIEAISKPYLDLLNSLYQNEFAFAQLADSSDLVAKFNGPSVDIYDPTVSIVISIFTDIRDQIRAIAKSIVGLSTDQRFSWPAQLDPHLSGIAHGSLIVGITVPSPGAIPAKGNQLELDGLSSQVFDSVRGAVRSLSVVARHIDENKVNESIREEFPDPAVRDTVMVAAKRLSPTGRKGIDSVSFYSPQTEELEPTLLTPSSRIALSQALAKPVKVKGYGDFEGVVREIDLDAKRFEIRGVRGIGAIRCVYEGDLHRVVRSVLDSRVVVRGNYETLDSQQPRLIAVDSMEILKSSEEQLNLPS